MPAHDALNPLLCWDIHARHPNLPGPCPMGNRCSAPRGSASEGGGGLTWQLRTTLPKKTVRSTNMATENYTNHSFSSSHSLDSWLHRPGLNHLHSKLTVYGRSVHSLIAKYTLCFSCIILHQDIVPLFASLFLSSFCCLHF